MQAYLPSAPTNGGVLPYWLLITAGLSLYNVVQNYITLKQSKEVYGGRPDELTPLGGRLFAAYTMMSAGIRFAAAYNISNPVAYDLASLAFGVATAHFVSEWLIFGTVKPNRASIAPIIIGSSGLVWTLTQRSHYLGL